MKKNVDLIIFDIDGTLIDSKQGIVDSVIKTLTECHLPCKSPDEIVSFIGTGVRDLIARSCGIPDLKNIDEIVEKLEANFYKIGNNNARLFPQVREVLEYFKAKHMGVVTNRQKALADFSLQYFDIQHHFEFITGGDDIACKKPLACPLDLCMAHFRVLKDRAIIVGDMDIDIEAGKAAGIATCALTWGLGTREEIRCASPDYIIDTITQLCDIIE